MDRRIILITGANRGIGFETARQLGKAGHTILLGARTATKAEDAAARLRQDGIRVDPVIIDVTDSDSITKAVEYITNQYGKLDTLINNAAIELDGWMPASQVPLEVWRRTFETNFFGVVAVTAAFLPLLHRSEAGRIVNLSTAMGSLTLQADPNSPIYDIKKTAYDTSKTALNQYTVHLAYELRNSSIKVNSAHPGWVQTELGGPNAPMGVEDGAETSVWLATLPLDGPTGSFFHHHDPLPW